MDVTVIKMKPGLLDKLRSTIYGEDAKVGCCIQCKQPFKQDVNVFSKDGWNETRLSGLCESCFDASFQDLEDVDAR